MRHDIYAKTNDGMVDSVNVESAKERDITINARIKTAKEIGLLWLCYCEIYKSGEYAPVKLAWHHKDVSRETLERRGALK